MFTYDHIRITYRCLCLLEIHSEPFTQFPVSFVDIVQSSLESGRTCKSLFFIFNHFLRAQFVRNLATSVEKVSLSHAMIQSCSVHSRSLSFWLKLSLTASTLWTRHFFFFFMTLCWNRPSVIFIGVHCPTINRSLSVALWNSIYKLSRPNAPHLPNGMIAVFLVQHWTRFFSIFFFADKIKWCDICSRWRRWNRNFFASQFELRLCWNSHSVFDASNRIRKLVWNCIKLEKLRSPCEWIFLSQKLNILSDALSYYCSIWTENFNKTSRNRRNIIQYLWLACDDFIITPAELTPLLRSLAPFWLFYFAMYSLNFFLCSLFNAMLNLRPDQDLKASTGFVRIIWFWILEKTTFTIQVLV